jgi:hypothetical protein
MNGDEFKAGLSKSAMSLDALADPDCRNHVAEADVIWGVKTSTGEPTLFYGKSFLDEIIQSGKARTAKIMSFWYDPATTQLEYLIAAVSVLKGSHCYESNGAIESPEDNDDSSPRFHLN